MRGALIPLGLVLVVLLLVVVACVRGAAPPTPERTGAAPAGPPVEFAADPAQDGLTIHLSEGVPGAGGDARPAAAVATALSAAEVEALLGRLPPLAEEADDAKDFAKRASSLPVPRAGEVVELPFPPPPAAGPPAASGSILALTRRSPEGAVPIAGELSVTFSQPMVALGAQTTMNATRPVKLEPEPPGEWRWVGSQTLLFSPEGRMPMATRFTATVLAGTRSAVGGSLPQPQIWTFETPAPRVTGFWPQGGSVERSPAVLLTFDQRVKAEEIAGSVELRGKGGPFPLRLLRAEEIAAEKELSERVRGLPAGRFVALRPTSPLPNATTVSIVLAKGAPSAEGPLRTTADQQASFTTFGPFDYVRSRCGWRDHCTPSATWQLDFTNPIDGDKLDPRWVGVSPDPGEIEVFATGQSLHIRGAKVQAGVTYTVTLAPGLTDTHGQTLSAPLRTSFKVVAEDPRPPSLEGPGRDVLVLDPFGPAKLPIYTTNLGAARLRVWAVTPADWAAYGEEAGQWDYVDFGKKLGGRLLVDEKLSLPQRADEAVETLINLEPYLNKGLGQVVVMVEPVGLPKEQRYNRVLTWVQSTRIGLTAVADRDELLVWATDLSTGAPLPEVGLRLGADVVGQTDARGLATLPLAARPAGEKTPTLLVAQKGDDLAISSDQGPRGSYYAGSRWVRQGRQDQALWYIFDDRHMVKPGEEVFVKGLVRRFEDRKGGDVALLASRGLSVAWSLRDSRGNEVGKGEVPVDALGGFDLRTRLPDTINLGDATFLFGLKGAPGLEGAQTAWSVPVAEFRRPEFEVSAAVETAGPYVLGQHAVARVGASYYAGGPLPAAQTNWTVTSTSAQYAPPGFDGYRFGESLPWWWGEGRMGIFGGGPVHSVPATLMSRTDAAGQHYVDLHFAALKPARPMTVTATATVQDVNRQAWTASTSLLLHPAAVYVGVKPDREFYQKGQPIKLDVVAASIEGAAAAGSPIQLSLVRTVSKPKPNGEWVEVEAERYDRAIQAWAVPQTVEFQPQGGGSFRLTATVTDAAGRQNQTQLLLWVTGGEAKASRTVDAEELILIPDRESYAAGQTAHVLVQAPFAPAEALITFQRSGVVHRETRHLTEPSTLVDVPLEEGMVPGLTLAVEVVGQTVRKGADGDAKPDVLPRPAYASGQVLLKVPPLARTLGVTLTPAQAALPPGGSTPVKVKVVDAQGAPVADAVVALVAVDEAVLALSGYSLPDPVGAFYGGRDGGASADHSRAWVYLADPEALAKRAPVDNDVRMMLGAVGYVDDAGGMPMPAPPAAMAAAMPMEMETAAAPPRTAAKPKRMARDGAADGEEERQKAPGGGEAAGPAIAVRSDWNPTALWLPAVHTDGAGEAVVTLKLPDSLTRYRLSAVAVSGATRFGKADANVVARKPVMLRPSPPRFLNFGDRFELSYVVQNQTEAPVEVLFAARAANATLDGGAAVGRRFTVPAQDRVELRIPAAAAKAGTARFQAALSPARDPAAADAAEVSLPVWTPATAEAAATYGQLDGPRGEVALRQPIAVPGEVWPQFGGVEVSTSSTQLQALTDAVLYLSDYPYACAEQLASRTLAVAALKDVLGAFAADGLPDPATLQSRVNSDLAELARRQNSDNGWGFWRRDSPSWPYLSLHVAHALVRAQAKGFAVPPDTLRRALAHADKIERYIPREYGPAARRALRAYALYVLHLAGKPDAAKAEDLLREAGGAEAAPLEVVAWLLPTLQAGKREASVKAALLRINNSAAETAGKAHFVSDYGDDDYLILHSDRRLDGLLVDALIQVDPKNPLIAKVVADLLAHRTKGRWSSTQDNVWVLLAMDRYFHAYEGVTPDFVSRAWLGDRFAGDHVFKGRGTERAEIAIPMAWLSEHADQPADLTLSRTGEGRMYYRVGMRYAPRDLNLAPVEAGFSVERSYEAVDKADDVRQEADGRWVIRAGARVRVRLTMVAPGRRAHVALVDALPAGFEVINPELKVMGDLPPDLNPRGPRPSPWSGAFSRYGWWGPWYDHENLRDERVEAFTSLLYGGVYSYSYVARATTPGDFIAPPAKAEEMYSPETFGRSGTARVSIQ